MSEEPTIENLLTITLEENWTPPNVAPWRLPEDYLRSLQIVMAKAMLPILTLRQIEVVLLAHDALAAVMKQNRPDLLSPAESASLLTFAEETMQGLLKNDLGGFSDGNRAFWLMDAFKDVIEKYGYRNVGMHHSQDELEAMGAILPRR